MMYLLTLVCALALASLVRSASATSRFSSAGTGFQPGSFGSSSLGGRFRNMGSSIPYGGLGSSSYDTYAASMRGRRVADVSLVAVSGPERTSWTGDLGDASPRTVAAAAEAAARGSNAAHIALAVARGREVERLRTVAAANEAALAERYVLDSLTPADGARAAAGAAAEAEVAGMVAEANLRGREAREGHTGRWV